MLQILKAAGGSSGCVAQIHVAAASRAPELHLMRGACCYRQGAARGTSAWQTCLPADDGAGEPGLDPCASVCRDLSHALAARPLTWNFVLCVRHPDAGHQGHGRRRRQVLRRRHDRRDRLDVLVERGRGLLNKRAWDSRGVSTAFRADVCNRRASFIFFR